MPKAKAMPQLPGQGNGRPITPEYLAAWWLRYWELHSPRVIDTVHVKQVSAVALLPSLTVKP